MAGHPLSMQSGTSASREKEAPLLNVVGGSRWRRRHSISQARTMSKPVLVPANVGSVSSSGTPPA
jgi:hypothetical protein